MLLLLLLFLDVINIRNHKYPISVTTNLICMYPIRKISYTVCLNLFNTIDTVNGYNLLTVSGVVLYGPGGARAPGPPKFHEPPPDNLFLPYSLNQREFEYFHYDIYNSFGMYY